ANFNDLKNGVHETTEFLELFLRNLLLDEKNELHNRSMHISGKFNKFSKANIETQKADIGKPKANIEAKLANIDDVVLSKTKEYIVKLYAECGISEFFGRSVVERITGLKSTRASELIKLMLDNDIIENVQGHGKGKYRFK
ncbi:MAG: cell filamentation protein, partial [Lachnospiraceae bacterium]